MAPPLGLTCAASSGIPKSRRTASACEAKASFNSTTFICPTVKPALARTLRVAGAGPIPMTRGATPAAAAATTRAFGVNPWRFTAAAEARSSAHAPSLTPDAFPAVMVPSGLTIGFSFESASSVVSGRGCSSSEKSTGSHFLCGMGTGTISCSILPRDVKFLRDDFTCLRHRVGSILCFHQRVYESPSDGGVFHFHGAGIRAVGLAQHEGRPRHAFNPSGNDQVRFAAFDRARGSRDRVHTGAAKPVHGRSGNFLWQTSKQQCHAANVSVVFARLVGATVDHVIHGAPVHSCIALHQGANRDCREIIGANRRRRSAVPADVCPYRVADVSGFCAHPSSFSAPLSYTQPLRRALTQTHYGLNSCRNLWNRWCFTKAPGFPE